MYWLRHAHDTTLLSVFMPAVIVNGRLFEMAVTDDGREVIEEVRRSLVWCRTPGSSNASMLVNVVTADEVPAFAESSRADCLTVAERALTHAPEIMAKFKQGPFIDDYL